MTTQPDRQDGDGLPAMRACVEKIRQEAFRIPPPNPYTPEIVSWCIWMDAAIDRLATPQPARDAAEGAGEPTSAFAVMADHFGMQQAAPPKPAPDAMRLLPLDAETRRDLNVIFRSAVNQRLTGSGTWDDVIGDAINAIFKLAAPVPPADGALFECPGCGIEIGSQVHAATCSWQQNSAERFKASHQPRMSGERDPSVMPDCRSAETAPRKYGPVEWSKEVLDKVYGRSPSGAVAAEPVATPENAVYQKITGPGVDALENRKEQIAAPVRGDREAIADKAMHQIWKDWFEFYKRHFRGADIRISAADQMAFYEIAQPILRGLTLPVQLGAGERPNIMIYRVEEDDENPWVRVPGADIASVKLNSKIGRALLTLEADLRLRRQAPHSSSEGGR